MNFRELMNGASGNVVAGFVRSVAVSQLGFDLQRAAFQKEQKDVPVADAAAERELREAMGDNGLPERTVLNGDELVAAYAASFILLSRHCQTPDTDTGRKPEHLVRYLKTPAQIIQTGIDFRLERQIQQTRATALMLKADPTKRVEAITTELKAQAVALLAPMQKAFLASIVKFRDAETDALMSVIEEAMVNAGRTPKLELKRAAQALIDSQKKRFEAGEFAIIDAGIYALAGLAPVADVVAPVTPAAA